MLQTGKKEAEIIKKAIAHWKDVGLIDDKTSDKLTNDVQPVGFDWQKLAFYAFLFAIGSIIVSVFLLLADEWILQFIEDLIDAPHWVKSLLFAALAFSLYAFGYRRKNNKPDQIYSNETLFILGVISTAVSATFLGLQFDTGSGHFSLLILLLTAIYAVVAYSLWSQVIWLFFLVAFGAWFGTETGYVTNWEGLFWGMNYPLRYTVFSFLIVGGSFLIGRTKLSPFQSITYGFGLFQLFTSLWFLSIFGNHTDFNIWSQVSQVELWAWAVLMAAVSVGAIIYGLKNDDFLSRDFGIVFLLINLLSRYVEYGWDTLHKAVFFMILAVAFWLLGKKAETIWNLGRKKK
ncbi:MAG: hypothetical protein RIB71_07910 [Imperialibacter sp.]|uniref:hypothetical protein n=1 Tax=Imperialibacter sp. TaxID=2038411 RepID=UPI0032EC1582